MDPNTPPQPPISNNPVPQQPPAGPQWQPPAAPGAPAGVPPYPQQAASTNVMAILGLVFVFIFPLAGLVLSIIGLSQAKKRNESRTLPTVGIVVNLVFVVITTLIFAVLMLTTFTGVQQKARNTERQTDIKAIYGQVEAYNAQNGRYPTLNNLNDATWRATNMKGLDPAALKDPKGSNDSLVGTPQANAYAYAPVADDGGSCDNVKHDCTDYTLTTTLEGGGTFTRSALNNSNSPSLELHGSNQ